MRRRTSAAHRCRLAASLVLVALATLMSACRREALPEPQSPAAQLYLKRCGQCHIAYDPRALTASMWDAQMKAMDQRMAQAHVPLTAQERAEILEYLTRNAGGH